MSAEIVQLALRRKADAAELKRQDAAFHRKTAADFLRELNEIDATARAHIAAGRTFAAVYAAAQMVALSQVAESFGPLCVGRAMRISEGLASAIDASMEGRTEDDDRTFDDKGNIP